MNLKRMALITGMTLFPLALVAQSTTQATPATTQATPATTQAAPATTPTPGQHDYNINQRKTDQQDRIANGIKDGQINAGQASHLEKQEAGINKEERGMRAQDNGHLTKQDRQTIHHQQNQESRRIYRDRHGAKGR